MDRSNKFETHEWDINFQQYVASESELQGHFFYQNLNETFACLFYSIREVRMGWEAGLIVIFENKNKPVIIADPRNQWFDFQGKNSLIFSDNYLFVRKPAYNVVEKLSGTPFVVFDLTNKLFGFIDFDATSIYYSPVKISDTIYKLHLDSPNEMQYATLKSREGETFDITKINFYSFEKLSMLLEMYFDAKKINAC